MCKPKVRYNCMALALVLAVVCPWHAATGQELRSVNLKEKSASAQQQGGIEATSEQVMKEVNAAFDRYIEGWKRGDLDALAQVYATDDRVTAIWPDPTHSYPVQGWKTVRQELDDSIKFAQVEFATGIDIEYSPRHVEVYDNVGIVTTSWRWANLDKPLRPGALPLTQDGRDVWGKGQATFIFVKHGPIWSLVHEHVSVQPTGTLAK
jgi:ketosteroid isomerase-like protein